MSYQTDIVRLRVVAKSLGEWKNKVVFVGGATVSLYATRPQAVDIRPTDDVDVVVEVISLHDFYTLQEYLLGNGFTHDTESPIISRFLLEGLKVDFMPIDPDILGFSNIWYPDGVRTAINYEMSNREHIRIFTTPYFIASKMEAFKTRGKGDLYGSHDLEDIIFVLDNRDTVGEELLASEPGVIAYLKKEFMSLLSNSRFEEALIGHVEQNDQTARKNRIMELLTTFVKT